VGTEIEVVRGNAKVKSRRKEGKLVSLLDRITGGREKKELGMAS